MTSSPLAKIPKIDSLLQEATGLIELYGRVAVTDATRHVVDQVRDRLLNQSKVPAPDRESILKQVATELERLHTPSLRPVLNLTGTVLHTNLGRARLPSVAIDAMQKIGSQYSNLEYDLNRGERGDRDDHIESLIQKITGAESATVVNNNAAAVMLVLSALANDREVPVSRGELVEIGGSFRIPDIMSQSGCHLHEVGATNRTHARDYEKAINERTALLMKVHTSNYEINGFTHEVSDAEVAEIAHKHSLPFVTDLGSGTLVDLRRWKLPYETTVQDSLQAGADIVTFSGDKLLGGPQCGLIVGRRDLIDKIKQHPLKRAIRLDKMTIAALTEVLRLYLDPEQLHQHIPALRDLSRSQQDIRTTAEQLVTELHIPGFQISVCDTPSQIGSGALPTNTIPSAGLKIESVTGEDAALRHLEQKLRGLPVPVLGRIQNGALVLDLRTLDSNEQLLAQLNNLTP